MMCILRPLGLPAFILILCSARLGATPASASKGLFLIQFSWGEESYPSDYRVGILYTKGTGSKLLKFNIQNASIRKNETLALELAEGAYTITGIEFYGYDMGGKKLSTAVDRSFTVSAGGITNGGLALVIKDPGSKQTTFVFVDNQKDAAVYAGIYHKKYAGKISPAWTFIEDEKIRNLKRDYAKVLVDLEKAKPGRQTESIAGFLGLLIKLEKGPGGVITGYTILETNTYREIQVAVIRGGKVVCDLGQGHYLYGTERGLSTVPMPDDLESEPNLYFLDADKFLVVDQHLNIYSSTGPAIAWRKQGEYRAAPSLLGDNRPHVSSGHDKIYLFTSGTGKNRKIFQSGCDTIHFKPMEIPEDINKIPDIVATRKSLIIGPVASSAFKNQGVLYVRANGSTEWNAVPLPRRDCTELSVDENDESRFVVTCGFLARKWQYESPDAGKSWTEVE
jgi:hypothetical protein